MRAATAAARTRCASSLRLALDIMLSYSDKPLRLVAALGIFVSVIALGMTAFSLYRYLHGDVSVAGYTSVIASMWLLAGVMLFCMGIIGLYVGRVFESVKLRPHVHRARAAESMTRRGRRDASIFAARERARFGLRVFRAESSIRCATR